MAPVGGAAKRRRVTGKAKKKRRKIEKQTDIAPAHSDHRKHLHQAIPLLISAASAGHSFLLRHDLHLLPSQSLELETLISSTSRSLSHLISLLSFAVPPIPPPLLPPPQSNWFERFLNSPDHDAKWVDFFNLSKPSFTLLLRLLTPGLHSSLHPLPPNVALTSTLYRLSHAASFAAISRRFSLDSATACRAFYSVCKAIVENLSHLFELNSDINRVIAGFGRISLPNCCGVLGVEKFQLDGHENESLLVQALVDSEGRFLDVSAGWLESERPDLLLKRSKLFHGIVNSKEYLNGPYFKLKSGTSIPQYILGDSCYPLLPWLLTPYYANNSSDLSCSEMAYNGTHHRGLEFLDTAFTNLKKRWKLVAKKWKGQCIEAFPFVIVACCLLHNFLIKCNEVTPEENGKGEREKESLVYVGEEEEEEGGKRMRDALALHLTGTSHQ